MKSAKVGSEKYEFVLKVLESKTILPSAIRKALPEDYEYEGATIDIVGQAAEKDGQWSFAARGSGQTYDLEPCAELETLVKDGKTLVRIAGPVKEREEKDGRKPPPLISVTEAKEAGK